MDCICLNFHGFLIHFYYAINTIDFMHNSFWIGVNFAECWNYEIKIYLQIDELIYIWKKTMAKSNKNGLGRIRILENGPKELDLVNKWLSFFPTYIFLSSNNPLKRNMCLNSIVSWFQFQMNYIYFEYTYIR